MIEVNYCSECNTIIKPWNEYCPGCNTKLVWDKSQPAENEAKSQLVGIKIITIIGIVQWCSLWLVYSIVSVNIGSFEGIFSFFMVTLFFGGISIMHIFGLIGLIKRKAYTIPLSRANLIFSGGIIFWIILWGRLNLSIVKSYLNYGEDDLGEDLNQDKKNISTPQDSIKKEDSTLKETSRNDKIYCPFCRTELPAKAKYCKQCGEEI